MPRLVEVGGLTANVDVRVTGVYVIINILNGKRYFGSSSKSVRKRTLNHASQLAAGKHPNKHLQASWNKYGENVFTMALVEECAAEDCLAREQAYIDHYKTTDSALGYNLSPTAGSNLGMVLPHQSDERKEQERQRMNAFYATAEGQEFKVFLSELSKAAAQTPEGRAVRIEGAIKRWKVAGASDLRSAQGVARYESQEERDKTAAATKEARSTDESRLKSSAACSANWANEEYKRKILEIRRSDEFRENAAATQREKWKDPEYRKIMAASMKGTHVGKNCKLTESDVRQARDIYTAGGVSIKTLALTFNVGFSVMQRALTGKTWGHLT